MLNLDKISHQHKYNIQNLSLYFPFPLYDAQQNLIDSIIRALHVEKNGLFHSPTGTGKTLCFLVSILAYMDKFPDKKLKLIFCTKTHSQMNGIIKELKKSCYEPEICMMGSRNILCLNQELKKMEGEMKNLKCSEIKDKCIFFGNYDKKKNSLEKSTHNGDKLMDLEELAEFAKKEEFCPYYYCKSKLQNAKLIVLTYNYLLNPKIRKISEISLENAVVVFDEAHNIEEICEDLLSTSIKMNFFEKVQKVLQYIYNETDIIHKTFLQKLDVVMKEIDIFKLKVSKELNVKPQIILRDDTLKTFIKDILIDSSFLLSDQAIFKTLSDSSKKLKKLHKYISFIHKISFLQRLFERKSEDTQHFVVVLEKTYLWKNRDFIIKFNLFCFDPIVIFKQLLKEDIKNIFLTSGTLAPFDLYESRFRISFPIKVMNLHTINQEESLRASILTKGITKKIFDFSMKNRSSRKGDDLKIELGESLLNLFEVIPNGKLVFFMSYSYLKEVLSFWKTTEGNHIYQRIEEMKTKIFIETKTKSNKKNKKYKKNKEAHENYQILEEHRKREEENDFPLNEETIKLNFYKDFCENALNSSAVLFGVLRGKGSEGIDFADAAARGVFIVGIPFAPYKDIKVKLKMEYLDEIKRKSPEKLASGQFWYELQAVKSINQGIGRVIRHNKDYGVIALLDQRYSFRASIRNKISDWAKNAMENNNFEEFHERVSNFFIRKNKMFDQNKYVCYNDEINNDENKQKDQNNVNNQNNDKNYANKNHLDHKAEINQNIDIKNIHKIDKNYEIDKIDEICQDNEKNIKEIGEYNQVFQIDEFDLIALDLISDQYMNNQTQSEKNLIDELDEFVENFKLK